VSDSFDIACFRFSTGDDFCCDLFADGLGSFADCFAGRALKKLAIPDADFATGADLAVASKTC